MRGTVFALFLVLAGFCGLGPGQAQTPILLMATTTSTEDTGLLPELAKAFQAKTGIELRWVAVGTGKALEMGKACDADVLLVHAPGAERNFMDKGYGQSRREVMYNDFVVLGPASDPAGLKGQDVVKAMSTLAGKKAQFFSRGDNSGTHMAELALWKAAGLPVPDREAWYVSTGQGMLQTMSMAGERGGYCLADRGTFIKYEAGPQAKNLVILVEGAKELRNQYSVITLNPNKCPLVKSDLAQTFADWLVSPPGQEAVASFSLLGKQLFFPNAGQ